jgi:DNA helicase-2/ATP-dependent DNA helicase PcrA
MFNDAQISAIDCRDKRILCLAAAGSGKTSVLIERVLKIARETFQPASILVLTFTNAAAQEMRVRYTKFKPGVAEMPFFGTFHSFCYRLIIQDMKIRSILGYKQAPSVATDAQLKKLHKQCKNLLGIKLSDEKLMSKNPGFLSKKDKFDYDLYWKKYNQMLRESNLITFDIMCYEVAKLFSENNSSVAKYKAKYQYIFVDEFQDTDKKQFDFVKSFEDSSIFVVGDPRQAIYRFRGADSEIIKSLSENDDWTTIKLIENYRSTEQICSVANKTHDKIWGNSPYNLKLHANKTGDKVEYRNIEFCPESDAILSIIEGSSDGDSIAVLCRTNREVGVMTALLSRYKVPYVTNHDSDYDLHILKSAADKQYAVEWLSSQLLADDYNEYLRLCSIDPDVETDYDTFIRIFGRKISKFSNKINQISDILGSDSDAADAADKLDLILMILDKKMKVAGEVRTNDDIMELLTNPISQNVKGEIYVGTIHSVKGLEYTRVHLMGVDSPSFRLYGEDNLNLYYVGITRAKEHLTIWEGDLFES